MKNTIVSLFIAFALIITSVFFVSAGPTTTPNDWIGNYTFNQNGCEVNIRLSKWGDNYDGIISIKENNTYIICNVLTDETTAKLIFVTNKPETRITNHQRGDLVLEISKNPIKNQISYNWHTYEISCN